MCYLFVNTTIGFSENLFLVKNGYLFKIQNIYQNKNLYQYNFRHFIYVQNYTLKCSHINKLYLSIGQQILMPLTLKPSISILKMSVIPDKTRNNIENIFIFSFHLRLN